MPNRTINPQAQDFYTKGRQALRNRSKSDLNKALECFQAALASDPNFALAYSGLADAYTPLYIYHLLPLDQSLEKARAAARRAMEIDGSLAEVHTSVGHVSKVFDGDLDRAEKAYRRAITIDVLEEALAQTRTASPMGRLILGQCYLQKGLYQEALDEFQKAQVPSDAYTGETDLSVVAMSLVGITFARMGEKDKAGKILADLVPSADEEVCEPCWLGLLCIALDKQDQGFQFLEQALESGDMWLRYILVQPLFDDIRAEVGYKALLEKMNLEDIPLT